MAKLDQCGDFTARDPYLKMKEAAFYPRRMSFNNIIVRVHEEIFYSEQKSAT